MNENDCRVKMLSLSNNEIIFTVEWNIISFGVCEAKTKNRNEDYENPIEIDSPA